MDNPLLFNVAKNDFNSGSTAISSIASSKVVASIPLIDRRYAASKSVTSSVVYPFVAVAFSIKYWINVFISVIPNDFRSEFVRLEIKSFSSGSPTDFSISLSIVPTSFWDEISYDITSKRTSSTVYPFAVVAFSIRYVMRSDSVLIPRPPKSADFSLSKKAFNSISMASSSISAIVPLMATVRDTAYARNNSVTSSSVYPSAAACSFKYSIKPVIDSMPNAVMSFPDSSDKNAFNSASVTNSPSASKREDVTSSSRYNADIIKSEITDWEAPVASAS